MKKTFHFTAEQRSAIAKELGTELGIRQLERVIDGFITESATQMTLAEMAEHVRQVAKSCKQARASIRALSKGNLFPAEWITEPLNECERCAAGLYKYRFSGRIKRGRRHNTARIHLVQVTALYWEDITGGKPGLGRGPFSRLIGKMLRFSGVDHAAVKYPDELVREALPIEISIEIRGPDHPFANPKEQDSLPPLALAAEMFFGHVLWAADGSTMAFALESEPTGTIDTKK